MPQGYYLLCCAIVKAAVPVVCANSMGCKPGTFCNTGGQAEQQQCLWCEAQVSEVWR